MPAEHPSIGVLSPLGMGFYFGGVINGVREAADAAGYRTITLQSVPAGVDESAQWDPGASIRPVGWSRIAGFVSMVNAVDCDSLRAIAKAGKPLVVVSQDINDLRLPVVVPDNMGGVRQSVEHLIEHGHRRIAFAGDLVELDIEERYAGYLAALRDHGIEPDPDLFFKTGAKAIAGGTRAAAAMLAAGLPSTAVIAATDLNAIGIMTALSAAGVRLPREQAIVGFDDGEFARHARPSLSTVAQDFAAVGRAAGELVLAQLHGERVPAGRHWVATRFVARQSCGCGGTKLWVEPAPRAIATGDEALPRIVRPLAAVLADVDPAPDPSRAATLSAFAAAFAAAFESGDDAATWDLRAATEALWAAVRPIELRQLTALFREGAKDWLAMESGMDQNRATRLEEVLLELSLTLGATATREQFDVAQSLQRSLTTQYDVSMDLLGGDTEKATGLLWLSRTTAVAGMLAVRGESPDDTTLTIQSVFARDGMLSPPSRTLIDEREFPPEALLSQAAAHPGTAILIVSIHGDGREQALLAVVAPVDDEAATGQETFHQWAALVGAAFEHQRLLNSLQRRQSDLAESLERERRLAGEVRESEQRYALAATAANDGLWDWDLVTGAVYYSDRALGLLGALGPAAGIETWLGRVHLSDREGLDQMIGRQRAGCCDPLEYEHRVTTDKGETRWILCRALAVKASDAASRIVGSFTDVTARHELEEKLRHQALYDALTALPNRILLIDRLEVSIRQNTRFPHRRFAVLFIDLDGFKAVNDTFGHAVGDKLLVAVASRLRQFVRSADTAARLGGDEFVVLMQDMATDADVAGIVARLRDDLALPFDIDGRRVAVTASIGIATSDHGYNSAEQMLRDADISMYQAKAALADFAR